MQMIHQIAEIHIFDIQIYNILPCSDLNIDILNLINGFYRPKNHHLI